MLHHNYKSIKSLYLGLTLESKVNCYTLRKECLIPEILFEYIKSREIIAYQIK